MKRIFLILIVIFVLLVAGIVLYFYYAERNFVEKNFIKYTGVKEYIIKTNYNDNIQSYFEVIVSQSNKRLLLDNFIFEKGLEKLKGRVEPDFFESNSRFIYHVIEKGYGPYGYIFFALEKEGNILIVYEHYGN